MDGYDNYLDGLVDDYTEEVTTYDEEASAREYHEGNQGRDD